MIFRKLFDAHRTELQAYIYFRSGQRDLAEDLVQESFLKLWQNCAKVPYEKVRGFLYKVLKNQLYNRAEHEKVVLKFQLKPQKTSEAIDPQFLLEEKEFSDRLAESVSELPEGQRVVFLMNRIEKKKYREIADLLGISVKAVEKRMHLALVSMRKIHQKI